MIESKIIAACGLQFAAQVGGEGDHIIFLHGGNSRGKHFQAVMEILCSNWRVIAYDQRGFGQTQPLSNMAISHQHWRDDADAIRQACGVQKVHIVGWSLGATVALNVAATYSQTVKSIILLGAPNLTEPVNKALLDKRIDHYRNGGTQADLVEQNFGATLKLLSASTRRHRQDIVKKIYEEQLSNHPQAAPAIYKAYRDRPDVRRSMTAITCSIHIIVGDEDPICGAKQAEILKQDLSQSEITLLKNCGHYYAVEQAERVAQVIAGWLESQ